jgi:molybdate transport system permease protein
VTRASRRSRRDRERADARALPLPVTVLALVAAFFFALPLLALLWRAPWGDAWALLRTRDVRDALWLSLVCSSWSTVLSVLLGVPLAWLLSSARFPGRGPLRALCTMSMVLPPVVGGVARMLARGRPGRVGRMLERWLGGGHPVTTPGGVVGEN